MAQDGAVWNRFGRSFAIDGDTLVGGARFDYDNRGVTSGSAHVFVRSGREWSHQAKLLAPDGAVGDYFGSSTAIFGEVIVFGAYGDDDDGDRSRSAHVFVRGEWEWFHQAKLLASDGAANDEFGTGTTAIYKNTVVVGADGDSGSAHIFAV